MLSELRAVCVCSRVQPTCLTTCKAAIWHPGIALNPSGFSPEVVRSVSTCLQQCIHEVYRGILSHLLKSGKGINDNR
jgi:hypothetical protein